MLDPHLTPAAARLVEGLQAEARLRFDGSCTPYRTGMVAGLTGKTLANPYTTARARRDFASGVVKGRKERTAAQENT